MRITFTPSQVAMLIDRAERQLEQIVTDALGPAPNGHGAGPGPSPSRNSGRNIARASHHTLHETVVTLIRLYREQVAGGAPVATRIAREYAKGADAQSGAPTLACVRTILAIVHGARAQLPPPAPAGQAGNLPR
jgi:hypothetical protein